MPTHPLELPEILTHIGFFLPPWEKSPPDFCSVVFNPKTLLSCLLVNKLWYRTLLPVLWHTYDYSASRCVPTKVVTQNSCYFRALYWSGGWRRGPFHCQHLTTLIIHGPHWRKHRSGELSLEKDIHRQLVRSNPDLRTLAWCGPTPRTTLTTDDFLQLKNLRHLRLSQWDATGGKLERILRVVAESLETLELESVLSDQILPGEHQGQRNNISEEVIMDDVSTSHPHDGTPLVLPLVTKVSRLYGLKSGRDLQEVAFLCPNMKHLSLFIDCASSPSLKEGIECLQAQCPKIQDLFLKHYALQDTLLVDVIQNCSQSGLTSLDFSGRTVTDDIVLAIMTQAKTLGSLKISTNPAHLSAENALLMLTGLTKLRNLQLCLGIIVTSLEDVETWCNVPWARGLETLFLRFTTHRVDDVGDEYGIWMNSQVDDYDSDSGDINDNISDKGDDGNDDQDGGVGRLLHRGEEAVLDKVFEQVEGMKNMRSLKIFVNCVEYVHHPSK